MNMELYLVLLLISVTAGIVYVSHLAVERVKEDTERYKLLLRDLRQSLEIQQKSLENQQEEINKQLDDQAIRIGRREKELDRVIQDIPRRVDTALAQAVAQFVEPYRELQQDMVSKGVAAMPHEEIRMDLEAAELERALKNWEAGIGR